MRGEIKTAMLRASTVLIPSYTAAYLTGQMVYVVPTLAAAGFFAASIGGDAPSTRNNIDNEGDEAGDGASLDE
jgi:hypothetical protein